jgi:hypothetical protein
MRSAIGSTMFHRTLITDSNLAVSFSSFASYHGNVTFKPLLPKWRARKSWKPKRDALSPRKIKCLSLLSQNCLFVSTLLLSFLTPVSFYSMYQLVSLSQWILLRLVYDLENAYSSNTLTERQISLVTLYRIYVKIKKLYFILMQQFSNINSRSILILKSETFENQLRHGYCLQ